MKTHVLGSTTGIVLSWSLCVHAANANGPQQGDKPPLWHATALLQAPRGARLDADSVRGKVVVLEFWATWCGPCVAAIRHMNELAEKFKDKPVQFIAITAEDAATIRPFLKQRPIKGWVALDEDKTMNRAYAIGGIPETVIVGKDGTIAAMIHPRLLSEQMLGDVLSGKKVSFPELNEEKGLAAGNDPDETTHAPPLFEVLVRPSTSTNRSSAGGGGRFTAVGYTISDILPRAFDQEMQNSARIMTTGPLPEGRFDIVVAQKSGSDQQVTALLQQVLKSTFGLVGRKETRDMDVLLLRVKRAHAPGLRVSPTPGRELQIGPGIIEGTDFSTGALAMGLETELKVPVFDETGLTNGYDISLRWDQKTPEQPNPQGVRKAVEDQLGLELVPSKRPVEVTVIERAQ